MLLKIEWRTTSVDYPTYQLFLKKYYEQLL